MGLVEQILENYMHPEFLRCVYETDGYTFQLSCLLLSNQSECRKMVRAYLRFRLGVAMYKVTQINHLPIKVIAINNFTIKESPVDSEDICQWLTILRGYPFQSMILEFSSAFDTAT